MTFVATAPLPPGTMANPVAAHVPSLFPVAPMSQSTIERRALRLDRHVRRRRRYSRRLQEDRRVVVRVRDVGDRDLDVVGLPGIDRRPDGQDHREPVGLDVVRGRVVGHVEERIRGGVHVVDGDRVSATPGSQRGVHAVHEEGEHVVEPGADELGVLLGREHVVDGELAAGRHEVEFEHRGILRGRLRHECCRDRGHPRRRMTYSCREICSGRPWPRRRRSSG